MATIAPTTDTPVLKNITVKTEPEHAFRVFTEDIDSWWPREYHIGKAPLKKMILEGKPGGRCYADQTDGTESDWGRVLVWDPPRRLVIAWQITPEWGYEPDPARASEVEVRFTPQPGGSTRVDLEHRHLKRHGAGWENLRTAVESEGGWSFFLERFAARVASISA